MEVVQMRRCRRLSVLGRLQDEFVVLMSFLHKESMYYFFSFQFCIYGPPFSASATLGDNLLLSIKEFAWRTRVSATDIESLQQYLSPEL